MKLFWKVFLSVITMMTLIFCVSSHLLIYMFWDSSVENKVKTMKQLHVSVYHSLEETTGNVNGAEYLKHYWVEEIARVIRIPESPETVQVRVRDERYNTVFQKSKNDTIKADRELLEKVSEEADAYEISRHDGKYYMTTVSMESLNGQDVYVESVSDITDIFQEKDKHYQMYMNCMFVFIGVTVILAFVLAVWLVKPVQEKQKEHMEELEQAAKRQEQFTSSFAHELKTPLTSIIGYSDMLRSMKMDEEARMRYGSHIFNQGKRLEMLSKKMMELIVLQKTDFEMKIVDLGKMFTAVQDELQPVLEGQDIVLTINANGICVNAEPDLLKSVLMNMVDNSRKAIESGGQICMEAFVEAGQKKITVADNGKGIPQEDIARVTECFYMADKSRKYEGGSAGLGLSICKEILDLHHASMNIDSEVGKGTKITICFGEEL